MRNIKFLSIIAIVIVLVMGVVVPATASNNAAQMEAVDLILWSKEGEEFADAIDLEAAFEMWAEENAPGSTLTVELKDVEELRTELQTAALAEGEGMPHFLWTVADHAGPFTEVGIVQPLDGLFDMGDYLNTVNLDGQTWGIPFSAGNHLMLIYNMSMVPTPPATVEELIALSEELKMQYADVEGFVPFTFSHEESFWVFPWMQAINPDGVPFVGFAADGVTPDLNNDSLIKTYEMLYSLKDEYAITASECNYDCLNGLIQEGSAAMTINGDWSLGGDTGMIAALGDDLGLAPFPMFEGGQPAPLIAGTYAMIPTATTGAELDAVVSFLSWYTTDLEQIKKYSIDQGRLPGYLPAFEAEGFIEDPVIAMSAQALSTGVPQPVNVEMRCLFDAVKQEYQAVMNGSETPEDAAANAQDFAETCVADLQ